jgi:CheY-like chemotaxis protein
LVIFLEHENFKVITANNGKKAFDMLRNLDRNPDIIISDIMMPGMNGYELFKAVSNDFRLCQVPFIFLSARSSIQDVRLGKILGVDDYITKPFRQADLLAVINGKIERNRKIARINEDFNNEGEAQVVPALAAVYLIHSTWDDKRGPVMNECYPREEGDKTFLHDLGLQLFSSSAAIYGQKFTDEAKGILLSLGNVHQNAYVFFDASHDAAYRSRIKFFMLGVIAPSISYFDSLSIKKILQEIASTIKAGAEWDITRYHERILDVLKH